MGGQGEGVGGGWSGIWLRPRVGGLEVGRVSGFGGKKPHRSLGVGGHGERVGGLGGACGGGDGGGNKNNVFPTILWLSPCFEETVPRVPSSHPLLLSSSCPPSLHQHQHHHRPHRSHGSWLIKSSAEISGPLLNLPLLNLSFHIGPTPSSPTPGDTRSCIWLGPSPVYLF